ncbi:FkbM family methyltransferase [Croceifilum oryzae]|uniref:FkbM family methyltransferase n=1 Tax=Croceifilum oryzae TaxID=1553429 RepID=A0AAJ1TF74_9BACL|nr:FkbM family methyltransferase [Croceifilum oryzae]MDQ0417309.1 FkbM family methyltransferase [Croceifilum oryzae]
MEQSVLSISKRDAHFDVLVNQRNAWLWHSMHYNNWEEYTFNIFDRFLDLDHTYLDFGAFLGPTVLYAAHKAKHVYAVEPDPVAFGELNINVKLNSPISPKVTLINSAISGKTETSRLYSRGAFGYAVSSLMPTISDDSCEVQCITIADLIHQYHIRDVNFVKMDIEGGEYALIPCLKEFLEAEKPTFYVSIHGPFLKENISRLGLNEEEAKNRFEQTSKDVLKVLSMYKYIYDNEGNLLDENDLRDRDYNGEFVFTDERW